ncbi:hypothetical protein HanPSC8_Chr09g0388571 [Helianthus annuus]|nr:hypothetical protein HanPSC8_Chr09g0388571 [Helianthus annuus]
MLEDDKKAYDLEKKAFATLTQALNKDIYHQFSYCKDTKTLWDALVARGEGNAATSKDMVNRFADALPPKWSSFIELLKHTGTLDTVNIYEFIQKLEHKNDEEIRKAKRVPAPQNTEMYLPGFDALARSNAAQQPKLQTAFVSNTSSFPFPQSTTAPAFDPRAYIPTPQPPPQVNPAQPQFDPRSYIPVPSQPQSQPHQQAHYANNPPPHNPNTIRVDTSNLSQFSIEVAKEHMEIINTMVSAYCGLAAGQKLETSI